MENKNKLKIPVGMYLKDAQEYFPDEKFLIVLEDGVVKNLPQEENTNIYIEDGIITEVL